MKRFYLYIVFTFIIMISIFISSIMFIYSKDNVLNDNYIAVFKGNNTSTYVYTRLVKKKGKVVDVVFKYINTEIVSYDYDDSYCSEVIIKKAKAKNIDDLFDKAIKNNADSYVYLVNTKERMTINSFKDYLLRKKVDSYEE